jgi:ribosomal protein S12 methylthiotransferase accessory factor
MGLISALTKNPEASIASVNARIGISDGERQSRPPMSGYGRTLSYRQSQLTAITEALERYGGQRPKGKRTGVRASYRQLGEQALDPTTLGLHTAEQYALPGYRYIPYHHDLVCRWVWGYSFQRQRPILIPEHVAYYGLYHDAENANSLFVQETSNGCALGNCLEEAIFHGILEVIERDAFLMAWYAQLGLPHLDPRSARDSLVGLLIEHIERTTGYTLSILNSTLDHAVPCCWVLAVDEQNRDGMPKAMCAAGSHPHPEQAVINALLELASTARSPHDRFQKQRAHALEMLGDPLAVRELEDHPLLYFLPEAFERLRFLFHSPQQETFQQAFDDFYRKPASIDLRADLRELIEYYLRLGIDIITVDQTTTEQALQNFHCVKVMMPGMLPMTFGQQYRRISGFQRLYQLPYRLGYRTRSLTDAELNPHPHPFA